MNIYINNLLYYERPNNYKEIELNLLNTLLDNLINNKDEKKYFDWLYNLYLLLQKYCDWNNRVWLLLKMALKKKWNLDLEIKKLDKKVISPKFEILINWMNDFVIFFIEKKLIEIFWNLESFDPNSIDNVILEFNNSLDIKTPENILEKLSGMFNLKLDIVKEEFIKFMVLKNR